MDRFEPDNRVKNDWLRELALSWLTVCLAAAGGHASSTGESKREKKAQTEAREIRRHVSESRNSR